MSYSINDFQRDSFVRESRRDSFVETRLRDKQAPGGKKGFNLKLESTSKY